MVEQEGNSSERVRRSILRVRNPLVGDYGQLTEQIDTSRALFLNGGENPIGTLPQYEEILQEMWNSGERLKAGKSYEGDISEGLANLEKRWGEIPYGIYSMGGATGIEERLFTSLVFTQRYQIFGIGPEFPIPVNFAYSANRDESSRYFPYYASLWATLEDTIKRGMNHYADLKRPRVILYVNNPDTPKGDSANPEALEELAAFTEKKGWILVVDEAFGDFLPDENSAIPLTRKYRDIVVIRSFSKGLGLPGEDIGYLISSKGIGDSIDRLRRARDIRGVAALSINKLSDPDIALPHFQKSREKVEDVKSAMRTDLTRLGISVLPTDDRVPILTVDGKEPDFDKRLLAQNLIATSLDDFKYTHPALEGNRFVRISMPQNIVDGELQMIEEESEIFEVDARIYMATRPKRAG